MFLRRIVKESIPSWQLSLSMADSMANAGWVAPYPRKAPDGTVFVETA
jgi:hypothetical protein